MANGRNPIIIKPINKNMSLTNQQIQSQINQISQSVKALTPQVQNFVRNRNSGSSQSTNNVSAQPTNNNISTITDPVTKKQYSRDTSIQGSTYKPVSNIVTPDILSNAQTVKFPGLVTNDYSDVLNGLKNGLITTAEANTKLIDQNTNKNTDLIKQLQDLVGEPPSTADAYKKAQNETQILEKQQAVNNLTGQLNTIVNQGQANQLSLVGQGRGIPEAIIGGQQAQISRETAIQALPIQAQLSAAQGNLEMANQNLNTLFKIYSDDATNEYNYKRDVATAFKDVATSAENKKLDIYLGEIKQKYEDLKTLNEERLGYVKMAFSNNQSLLGSKIIKLDQTSPTFKEDLAKLASQLIDPNQALDTAIKQQQLIKAKNENVPTSTNTDGAPTPTPLNAVQIQALQSAKDLLTKFDSGVTSAVGRSNLLGSFGYSLVPGTDRADFIAQFDNLKSLLSLDNIKLLKGQGQVSDAERKLLADASTKLNRNQSESEFRATLLGIIDTFNKASPEYQYINNISGAIDSSGTSSTSAYVQSILNQ